MEEAWEEGRLETRRPIKRLLNVREVMGTLNWAKNLWDEENETDEGHHTATPPLNCQFLEGMNCCCFFHLCMAPLPAFSTDTDSQTQHNTALCIQITTD